LIQTQAAAGDAFVVSLFTMIAFCFIPASFGVFVVREREVKAKHQQIISGVSLSAYWTSTFVWDTLSYLPTGLLVLGIIHAYGIEAYTMGDGAGAVVAILLLFGPSVAAFTYWTSFVFTSHSTAQVMIMFFNFITGLCLGIVSFVLINVPRTSAISPQLRYIFRIFPAFCFSETLMLLALCDKGQTCPMITKDGFSFAEFQGPMAWDIAGANITFMGFEIAVYFIFTLMTEYALTFPWIMSWLTSVRDPGVRAEVEDEDVVAEAERVRAGLADNDVVRIANLRKVYRMSGGANGSGGDEEKSCCSKLCCGCRCCGGNKSGAAGSDMNQGVKVAVQNLSFGIPKGECFGFLGINGAGKTTTLSILSGEFPPTSGNAYIDGFSIAGNQSKIRRKIGYCPQFDALRRTI
jgi:ATP-binding cassette subfamily A (ABC1) protein 3